MRCTTLVLVFLGIPGLLALGQDGKRRSKAKEPRDPKVWMCKRGDLLWQEGFAGTEFPESWHKGKGDWVVAEGALSGAEVPADNHQAYCSRKVTEPNAVLQFSFKLDGAQRLGAFFDGKEHVAALAISADGIRLRRMSGIGPTTKSAQVDETRLKLDDGRWHTVVWEVYGDEMVATVDDQTMALARAEGLSTERLHLELNTGGGKRALFKDVKVWKAEADRQWPRKRARLLQLLKKKPASVGYR